MSYFMTMRTGLPGSHQFSPRNAFASFEQAHDAAERAFASKGAEYLIEDEYGPVTYRLKDERAEECEEDCG
jgi:hypothetical protein